jgi:hypothetical protein
VKKNPRPLRQTLLIFPQNKVPLWFNAILCLIV